MDFTEGIPPRPASTDVRVNARNFNELMRMAQPPVTVMPRAEGSAEEANAAAQRWHNSIKAPPPAEREKSLNERVTALEASISKLVELRERNAARLAANEVRP